MTCIPCVSLLGISRSLLGARTRLPPPGCPLLLTPIPPVLPRRLTIPQYALDQVPALAVIGGTLACGVLLDVEQCRAIGSPFAFLWFFAKLAEYDWKRWVAGSPRHHCRCLTSSLKAFSTHCHHHQLCLTSLTTMRRPSPCAPLQGRLCLGGAGVWVGAVGRSLGGARASAGLCPAPHGRRLEQERRGQ